MEMEMGWWTAKLVVVSACASGGGGVVGDVQRHLGTMRHNSPACGAATECGNTRNKRSNANAALCKVTQRQTLLQRRQHMRTTTRFRPKLHRQAG
ncbi:hypothetical protein Dda_3716 [Drechslerella dactyloides]|uniref:Secreted protein n=1 Tax=Drechslerella dactyloides TaxID=74499 RepID=A0AAD6IYX3_DREDA|nr:hypothetical protein Dda_3716 [Drechslerella dactyloides]